MTILNPNKTPAFNYTALKYFSQLIATGENKINLIFETDSHRESPPPGAPAASKCHATGLGVVLVLSFQVPPTPSLTVQPPTLYRETEEERVKSFCVAFDTPKKPCAHSFWE